MYQLLFCKIMEELIMKPVKKAVITTLLVCSLGGFAAQSALAEGEALQVQQHNGISYVSGGVSDSEQATIKEMGKDYNLQVLAALEEGNYLSDVDVTIVNAQGETVLQTVTNGPMLFAQLPAGSYTVYAKAPEGAEQQQSVQVASSGQAHADFRW